jgi:signal transduction histidine kinase
MSRASHELRTPLNAILGFAQLFQLAPDLAPKYRNWADLIADNGRHLLELVEKLIDLSAAQSGRPMTQPTDIDLVKLLRAIVALADESAHSASLTLVGPGEDAAPILMHADPAQLQHVVDNLLSNAIKYTPAGGKVTVSAADLHDRVEIAVEDTGIGLSAEQIDRIGSPFDRLGAEWTTLPGSGLGLALTKTLVGLLGGTLRVESVEGAGSIFRCVVPKRCG